MAFTIDQLNALEAAIAQGVRKVKYADKEVEYTSPEAMQTLRRQMAAELGVTIPGPVARRFGCFHKGA